MGKSPGRGGGGGVEWEGNLRTNVDFVAGVQSAYLLPYLSSAYPHLQVAWTVCNAEAILKTDK
jgi:hypothetical protein